MASTTNRPFPTPPGLVPVYDWLLADGTPFGCGTQVEFDHWSAEGHLPDAKLGDIICYEPASEDECRKVAWARLAA